LRIYATIDGPPNAVIPKRKKEVNNCVIDGCGLGDISTRKWPNGTELSRSAERGSEATERSAVGWSEMLGGSP
jgi:hypothetical protein